jgi:3-hydroxymyristoyl/3-hydroxydecanoyl-(acyl carrier protein) dehydratase
VVVGKEGEGEGGGGYFEIYLFIFPYLNVRLKFLLVFFVIYYDQKKSPCNMFNPIPINNSLGFNIFPPKPLMVYVTSY